MTRRPTGIGPVVCDSVGEVELLMPPAGLLLADLYAPVAEELTQVERRIDDELCSESAFVNGLCQRVERYRGKMLRPTLLLLSGKSCGRLTDEHITLAAVVEMVHLATLVHDDVLDAAEVRRKQATINSAHGNETAVLLGDYLISHAFHLCSSLNDQYASRLIGATTNTVCQGELMQINQRANVELSESEYLDIIRRKTAALTGTCCALGAWCSGSSPRTTEKWRRYGVDVGMAFQIVDDVLDCVGSQQRMGKTLGRDIDLGEPTLPTIHALGHADAATRRELARVLSNGHAVSRETIRDWLEQAGSIEYAYCRAGEYVASARRHLEALAESPAKEALQAATEFILQRQL
ncbi:MAG: polyprenyl synthetase family protein [Planctomycetota bacterium]